MENLINTWLHAAMSHEHAAKEIADIGCDNEEQILHLENAQALRRCATQLRKYADKLKKAIEYVHAELEEDFDASNGIPNKAMRLANELDEAMYGAGSC